MSSSYSPSLRIELIGSGDQAGAWGATTDSNLAGIGYTYDSQRDAFIPPQPYPSWTLVEETCNWTAPVLYPTDGKQYNWDEATINWIEMQL
jgi:hypothetical protein